MVNGEQSISRSKAPAFDRKTTLALIVLLASFLILYFVTTSTESGDTLRYAGDVAHHARGETVQFWEFGHLLWRPWGYLGLETLGPWFEHRFGDSDVQAVARFFIFTNFVCCLCTLFFVWDVLRQLVSLKLATAVAIAFCGANCFLDYAALGSAYLPALCFECLALWLLSRESRDRSRALLWTSVAGVSYAGSVLLWFPYIFVALGLLLFVLLWPFGIEERRPWRERLVARAPQSGVFLVAFLVVYTVLLAAGAVAGNVHTLSQFRQWIVDSDSGWSQHLNLVRAATGVPRSLFELAAANITLKRWFFHDPYNPVQISQLAGALFLKLALFYAGIAALLWILLRERSAWPTLAILLGASVPLLFFAIVVFEPGSTSRYLPLLPFLYLAAAVALAVGTMRRLAFLGVVGLLALVLLFNVFTLTHGASEAAAEVRRERSLLDQHISSHALVFIPTLHDEFYEVPLGHPVDHSLSSSKYVTVDIVEVASLRLLHWRAEFADRVLKAWKERQEVWLSQRVYADRPQASWSWVEGDDPRIKWADLPPFFAQIQTDQKISTGQDGFVRLADTPANESLFAGVVAKDPKYHHQKL